MRGYLHAHASALAERAEVWAWRSWRGAGRRRAAGVAHHLRSRVEASVREMIKTKLKKQLSDFT